jgi:hypothetical protein
LGEDFNFLVVTNNMITLYDIKLSKQKAKTIKQIPIQIQGESLSACYFEPMASTLVVIDSRGQVTVFYLSLHGVKFKGNQSKLSKQFNLDISLYDPNQAQVEIENPYAPKSTIAKMS